MESMRNAIKSSLRHMPRDAMVELLMQCYDEARAPTVTELKYQTPQELLREHVQELVDVHRDKLPTEDVRQIMKDCQAVHDSSPQLYRVTCIRITSHVNRERDDEGDQQEPVVELSSMTQTLTVELINSDRPGCRQRLLNDGKIPEYWLRADCPFVVSIGSELTIVHSIEKRMPTKRVRSD